MNDAVQRYKAPALEKGLDILELVATRATPISVTEIMRSLERSHGELFRMLQVLEFRGFIERAPEDDGYRLTDKLFALGLGQPRMKGLIETALPKMLALAETTGQSCHLAVHSEGQIVVVARMESSEMIGFSVRVGHRRELTSTVSGTVLYAFQAAQIRHRWEHWLNEQLDGVSRLDFDKRVMKAQEKGWASAPSHFASCITDLAAPIWRGDSAAAALAIPCVESPRQLLSLDETIHRLKACADEISAHLVASDARL